MEPVSSRILVGFVTSESQWGKDALFPVCQCLYCLALPPPGGRGCILILGGPTPHHTQQDYWPAGGRAVETPSTQIHSLPIAMGSGPLVTQGRGCSGYRVGLLKVCLAQDLAQVSRIADTKCLTQDSFQ